MKRKILSIFKKILGIYIISEYKFHIEGGDNGSYSWMIKFSYNGDVYSIDTSYFIGDPNGKQDALNSVKNDLSKIKLYGKKWKYILFNI